MGFLTDIETSVTSGFASVANVFGSGLLATFRPAFITGFTIWITLIAYEVAFGKSEDGATYLLTRIGKIFLIGVIALYGWPEVSSMLYAIKDGWVGGNTMSTVLETNLINPVTALWAKLFDWFTAALRDVGWTELGRLISTITLFALLFFAFTAMTALVSIFGAVALAMYLVANSIFILLLAIGPFFLLCLAFPFTQRFFETFIGNVMTAILGMAFTVLMVMFVANLFGLVGIQNIVPSSTDEATVATEVRSMVVLFSAKAAMSLLIIYLYYKVFDLAAALGGGLNMGNNMMGGVRAILRDAQRGSAARKANANQIENGGGSSGGGGETGRSQRRSGPATLTGMAINAVSPAISGVARAGISAGSGAGSVGRHAYNRYSQLSSRG